METTKLSLLADQIRTSEELLAQRVLGQELATTEIASLVNGWICGAADRAPRVLLLGPTGVGKTVSVETVGEAVAGCPPERFDMSEFAEAHTTAWWLGDRAGDRGRLEPIVRSGRRVVLLLDEIEKADPKVILLLLQMLEPGHLTLANGDRLDLRDIPIFCTSNVASGSLVDVDNLSPAAEAEHVLTQARRELKPELLNRFDGLVVFRPLDVIHQEAVLQLHLRSYLNRLSQRGYRLSSSPAVERLLLLRGFDRRNGARPLRRIMCKMIGDAIAIDIKARGSGCGELTTDNRTLTIRPLPHD